jgi:diphthine-ammonia ligase
MGKVACSWSGGKDCCHALYEAKLLGYEPSVLLCMIDEDLKTSRSHGLPVFMLEQQAKAMNLHLLTIPTSRKDYEMNFINALKRLQSEYSIDTIVFGDIDLLAHYEWLERVCKIAGINYVFPLWNRKREEIAQEIVSSGLKSIIVACNESMGESFLGKIYSFDFIDQTNTLSICPCGEDGEFHTFSIDGPLFNYPVNIQKHPFKFEGGFYFINWESNIV